MKNIVEQVADAIEEIPGDPSSAEIARIAARITEMWEVFAYRVRFKGLPKWRWAVHYGDPRWPSHSFWLVPIAPPHF